MPHKAGLTVANLGDALSLAVMSIGRFEGAAILCCEVTDTPDRVEDFAVLATVGTVTPDLLAAFS